MRRLAWRGNTGIVNKVYIVNIVCFTTGTSDVLFPQLVSYPADRQLDNEFRSLWLVVLDPDESVMIGNDAVDYRQPESRSRFLGRKIRFEQPGPVFCRDTMAGVGNYAGSHL